MLPLHLSTRRGENEERAIKKKNELCSKGTKANKMMEKKL